MRDRPTSRTTAAAAGGSITAALSSSSKLRHRLRPGRILDIACDGLEERIFEGLTIPDGATGFGVRLLNDLVASQLRRPEDMTLHAMITAPCDVWFYHLERTALDQALPELLDKTLSKGWKALVRARRAEADGQIIWMDWLGSYREDSFPAARRARVSRWRTIRQPVLLTLREDNPNQAQALFLIDGAEAGALDGFDRCILLFDGRDPEATALARERWKTFKQAGHPVSYWRQGAERGWEKQAGFGIVDLGGRLLALAAIWLSAAIGSAGAASRVKSLTARCGRHCRCTWSLTTDASPTGGDGAMCRQI